MSPFRWPLVEQDLRENPTSIENAENLETSNSCPQTANYGFRFAVNTNCQPALLLHVWGPLCQLLSSGTGSRAQSTKV